LNFTQQNISEDVSLIKLIMSKSSKLALSALLASSCDAAGMTAHNVAARRASQFEYFGPPTEDFNPAVFNNLASDRSDAIQAGAPFPGKFNINPVSILYV